VQNLYPANPVVRARTIGLVLALGACAWLLGGHVWAQGMRIGLLNTAHPLQRGLLGWWLVEPATAGGATWWSVLQRWPGTLTNMGTGSGWSPTARAYWYGEMRFDGVDDRVLLTSDPTFDFSNQTFTACAHFRTTSATFGYLISKRDGNTSTGWFVRFTPPTVYARIETDVASFDRATATGTYNDGLWHSFAIVFTTDTATSANNTITIYADGVLEQGTLSAGAGVYVPCTTCPLTFGAQDATNAPLQVALDNVRLYQRGLSAAEALAYHQDRPPDFGGLRVPEPLALGLPPLKRRITIE
jgi:concanavalin A-like lectin/glucanase superfamily protein